MIRELIHEKREVRLDGNSYYINTHFYGPRFARRTIPFSPGFLMSGKNYIRLFDEIHSTLDDVLFVCFDISGHRINGSDGIYCNGTPQSLIRLYSACLDTLADCDAQISHSSGPNIHVDPGVPRVLINPIMSVDYGLVGYVSHALALKKRMAESNEGKAYAMSLEFNAEIHKNILFNFVNNLYLVDAFAQPQVFFSSSSDPALQVCAVDENRFDGYFHYPEDALLKSFGEFKEVMVPGCHTTTHFSPDRIAGEITRYLRNFL